MFESFEQRGKVFKAAVVQLKDSSPAKAQSRKENL
jgi:hypothetical protein